MQETSQNFQNALAETARVGEVTQAIKNMIPGEKFDWLAGLIMAALIIFVGWLIAKFAGMLVAGAINKTGLGRRAKSTGGNIGKSLSKAVFWVLWLVFILMGLGQFDALSDQLTFVNGMLDTIFTYVPKVIGAAIVLGIGTILARVVKEALASTLEVAQVDNMATKFGFAGADEGARTTSISKTLGGLAGAIVILIAATSAFGILEIAPIVDLLKSITDYIPEVFGAAVILAIAVFIGRWVSNLVRSTLPALGVDDSLGAFASLDGTSRPGFVPSKLIATLTFAAILVVGLTAAMDVLNIPALSDVFDKLMEVGSKIVLGAIIIGVGLFIANFVSKIVTQTSGDLAGTIVKYATLIIVTFMGLAQMDLGANIVDNAFQSLSWGLGIAVGVGGAIAFGLGGREWAAKKLNKWWK